MMLVSEYAAFGLPGAGRLTREFLPVGAGQPEGQWVRLRQELAGAAAAQLPAGASGGGNVPRSGERGAAWPQLR